MKKVWIVLLLGGALAAAGLFVVKHRHRLPELVAALAPAATARAVQPLEAAEMLYDGKLAAGWDDWGWGPHQLGDGPAKVVFAGYGGILLHHGELPWQYGGVSFRYQAPPEFGDFLQLSLRRTGSPDDAFPLVIIGPQHVAVVDGWREVFVDWKELNPKRQPFDRVMIGSQTLVGPDRVQLDRIMLTKQADGTADAGGGGDRDESLRVQCDVGGTPISPLIYGSSSDTWQSGMSAKRMGGNPLSRLNWDLGAWNTGKDWYFENVGGKTPMFDNLDAQAKQQHTIALVVPMLGFVAKDNKSSGFPRSKFAIQRKFDPYRAEAGDGFTADGQPLVPKEPELTSIAAPPELISQWIHKVVDRDHARGTRSVHMYILDNEPSLWNDTHRDVHPEPLTYDELLDRTIKYASAIRDADPDAVIAGPAEWGWLGYNYSGLDQKAGVQAEPDRRAHGGVPLVAWYLRRLADYEKTNGKRLLDVFDLHFYPAEDGVYSQNADPVTSELRLRSTRSLWDPTYKDESWIAETIRLIPRMKDWVRENYPGRKLSLGEWSFGADDDISGALATAEALGRFGQQRLDAAFHWGDLKEGTATYWAFRAFRNFDGSGGRFQDVSLPAQEVEGVSLFASRDATTSRVVLVLINHEPYSKITTKIALPGCRNVASARAFGYARGSKALVEAKVDVNDSDLSLALPPFSLTVVDARFAK